jgi:phosphoribosylanthranilate isomerase
MDQDEVQNSDLAMGGFWDPDSRTRIKICGITNLTDALSSVAAGADMLGFNFYRKSPRFIEPERANDIIAKLPAGTLSVGVFVNVPTATEVAGIAAVAGVGAVQLHGQESSDFCRELGRWRVIKALRVGPGFDPAEAAGYETTAILLDGFAIEAFGGTGKTFDWNIAIRLQSYVDRLFLAGGLSVNNVRDAIEQVRPFAVDACSGLESRPGFKDRDLVEQFIHEVRAADNNA